MLLQHDQLLQGNYQTRNYYAYIAHLHVYKDDKIDKWTIG